MLDIAIIGGGPAGLSASIYAARAGLDGVLLERDGQGGGQIVGAEQIDNYPGLPGLDGVELAHRLIEHTARLGLPLRDMEVETVTREDGGFLISGQGEPVRARNVVYAAGAVPKRLGVPGEVRLQGKGVSYCAACDGAFFRGLRVAVVGGGDTAVGDALHLARRCDSVHLFLRRDRFRAAKNLRDRLEVLQNVTIYPNTQVVEILGEDRVEGVRISAPAGEETLPMAAVFVAVGVTPRSKPVQELGVCDADGWLLAGESGETAVPGLYAAGDVRKKPLRQLVTAAADGANCIASIMSRELSGALR